VSEHVGSRMIHPLPRRMCKVGGGQLANVLRRKKTLPHLKWEGAIVTAIVVVVGVVVPCCPSSSSSSSPVVPSFLGVVVPLLVLAAGACDVALVPCCWCHVVVVGVGVIGGATSLSWSLSSLAVSW
jgi:hypothetical protein